MEYFPAPLEKLVEQFARLPGIGSKSAQRLAFHVLNLPMEQAQEFANAIVEAKQKVTLCPICRNLTAGGPCPICANPKRDESLLCVVAESTGCHRHGAGQRVPWPLPRPPWCSVPHEPCGSPTTSRSSRWWTGWHRAASGRSSWPPTPTPRARPRPCIWPGC